MPRVELVLFRDETGRAPVAEWLNKLAHSNAKAWANCRSRLQLLAEHGHELRRPIADYLRDGIYELRAKQGHVQYRILYFFHGRQIAVLAHSLTKEDRISAQDFERVLKRKHLFTKDPKTHTYEA